MGNPAKLLIGLPVYDDFLGLWPTVQALRLYHAEAMPQVELAIIDNNPNGPQGQTIRDFAGWIKGDVARVYYVPYDQVKGPAGAKNLVFQVGEAPHVLCMDSHVFLPPGTVQRLIDWYAQHPDAIDLFQGPMVYDDLKNFATHFNDTWSSEMLGQWQTDLRGEHAGAPPFEIPATGMGLFSCRRDAWLGFNPKFKGFGGEEWYIHLKYKQAGRRTVCLPFLRWLHRFGRPGGPTYPLTKWHKVRNYVIGFRELGLDLKPIADHFLQSGLTQQEWDDIVGGAEEPRNVGCGTCGQQPNQATTLDEAYRRASGTPSDISDHVATLRDLASKSESVVELAHRPGISTSGLLAGRPKSLLCVGLTPSAEGQALARFADVDHRYEFRVGDPKAIDLPDCDLLFTDTIHTADQIYAELSRHHGKVRRWIAVHDTVTFGEMGEGGLPGLLPGIRRFMQEHPEWTVLKHYRNNNGLIVLTRLAEEKKELPALWKQGWNVLKASWRAGENVLKDYGPLVGTPTQEGRLALCMLCESRNNDRCGECSCFLDKKTSWPTEFCPLGIWGQAQEGARAA